MTATAAPIFRCHVPGGWMVLDPTRPTVEHFGIEDDRGKAARASAAVTFRTEFEGRNVVRVEWGDDVPDGWLDFDTLNRALPTFAPGNDSAVDPRDVVPRLLVMATVLRKWSALFHLACLPGGGK